MAMKAKVILISGKTHTRGSRTFERGKPQILTDAAEIKYYGDQGDFAVTILGAAQPKPKSVTPKAVETSQQENVEPETDEDDDLDDEDDDEGEDENNSKDATNDYKEAELKKMKKKELIEICDELGLSTDGTMATLIKRILEG